MKCQSWATFALWTFHMTESIGFRMWEYVVGIDGKTITTIEGNTSGNGDQRNGGMVMVKRRIIGKEVVGFGRPKYVPYKGEFPAIEVEAPKKSILKKEKKK